MSVQEFFDISQRLEEGIVATTESLQRDIMREKEELMRMHTESDQRIMELRQAAFADFSALMYDAITEARALLLDKDFQLRLRVSPWAATHVLKLEPFELPPGESAVSLKRDVAVFNWIPVDVDYSIPAPGGMRLVGEPK